MEIAGRPYSTLSESIRKRFGYGLLWNLLATVLTQGSVFVSMIVLARILGKDAFGAFGMIQSTVLTLAMFAQLATGVTATKYVAEFRNTDKARTGRVLGLCSLLTAATGAIATLLLATAAPWLAREVLAAPQLTDALRLAAAYVLFTAINGYQIGALAGLESYRSVWLVSAVLGVAHLVVCAAAALVWGLEGAMAGFAVSAGLRFAGTAAVLRRELGRHGLTVNRKDALQERDILLHFVLPSAMSGLTTMPALWLANAFLVRQPGGYSEMGGYSAANSLRLLILFLPGVLYTVCTSILNYQRGNRDAAGYRKVFWANLVTTAAIALFGFVIIALFGVQILELFGQRFAAEAHTTLLILALSVLPEAVQTAAYQLVQARGKMWLSLLAVSLPRDLTIVMLAYLWVPVYGAVGLASAYLAGATLAMAVVVATSWRLKLLRPY